MVKKQYKREKIRPDFLRAADHVFDRFEQMLSRRALADRVLKSAPAVRKIASLASYLYFASQGADMQDFKESMPPILGNRVGISVERLSRIIRGNRPQFVGVHKNDRGCLEAIIYDPGYFPEDFDGFVALTKAEINSYLSNGSNSGTKRDRMRRKVYNDAFQEIVAYQQLEQLKDEDPYYRALNL